MTDRASLEGRPDQTFGLVALVRCGVGGWWPGGWLGRYHGQERPASGELLRSVAVAEEAVVADALEPVGKDVEQKATDELRAGERHGLRLVAVTIVLPAEGNLAVGDVEQAIVGDGDAVV